MTGLLRLLPFVVLLCAAPLHAQPAPAYTGIDLARVGVADPARALAFYTKLFGAEVLKSAQDERRYLRLGQSYLVLDAQAAPGIERLGFGIDGFAAEATQGWLARQGIPWRDTPGGAGDAALYVEDRDRIRSQLAADATWEDLAAAAVREAQPAAEPPIFTAYAIDEVFMTVSNLEVDSLFYARLFDQSATQQAGALWFQVGNARLRLTQAPVGQQAGIAYFAVHVAFTDLEAAAEAVFAAGGIIENILPNGFSFWDPDGTRVVVRTGDLY